MFYLKDVEKEISVIVEKYKTELESKYYRVEHKGGTIICTKKNHDTIKLQAKADLSRRRISAPQSSREYQEQGGHRALQEKFERYNPDAWGIEVKETSSGSTYEIAFSGSESDWDAEDFEKNFITLFMSET